MLLRRDRALLAVDIALDVAFHAGRGAGEPTGAGEIAERLGAARRGIEPILQALTRAGLLDSTRGPRGGYRLARAPRDLHLSELVEAVVDGTGPGGSAADGGADEASPSPLHARVAAPLWAELEEGVRERLAALTLDDLLRRAAAAGLRRPAQEPIDFAI